MTSPDPTPVNETPFTGTTTDLPQRLVRAADLALANEETCQARAAVVAVLQELDYAGYLVIRTFDSGNKSVLFSKIANEIQGDRRA